MYEVGIDMKYAKRGGLILHGEPNTGKTTITEMYSEIFHCWQYLQTHGNFDVVPTT